MSKTLRYCLLITLTTVLSLQAGTFTNDFNSGLPAGTTCYDGASGANCFVDSTGGPDGSGCLKMTTAVNSQTAGYIINELDAGAQITGFTANFQLVMGGGTATPADGFSFNFANDVPDGTITEEGAPTTGFTVEFDTYLNAPPDDIGIDLKWHNAEIATFPWDLTNLMTWPTYVPMQITMTSGLTTNAMYSNAVVSVTFGTNTIYTAKVLSGFLPFQGRFGLGARSGGANQNTWVDNLGITTTPVPRPYVQSDAPTGANIRPDPIITVVLADTVPASLNRGSIYLQLNGVPITPTITPASPLVTLTYSPPSPYLPSGSTNTVLVSFLDSSSSVRQTNQFTFVVTTYPTLPASYVAVADVSQPGFTERFFQSSPATVSSVAQSETMLAGLLLNPANGQLWPNNAQTNTDGTYTFVEANVLNYSLSAPATAGDFPGDTQYPGIPGPTGATNNFAMEAITYLYLTAGTYTFGVNSDDGFRVSSLSTEVGVYDAGRGAADTLFSFAVTTTGYYPFRLVHFQGASAASLEWFSVTPAGQKILINDTSTTGFIPAYRKATSSRPYFLASTPYGAGNRPDKPILVQMQDGVGIGVNTNTIHLLVNGAAVTPSITQTAGVTTVQYSTIWASSSATTATVWFADSAVSPVNQTNLFTFSALAYANLPATYAISGAALDTSKPGFLQRIFQTDQTVPSTLANAEIMLAGQLTDAFGNLYPNKATANTDGTRTFAQTNVLNYNITAPASAGNFANDTQFPGMPGASGNTNTFALEAITYLYLPVGYYSLSVNSDDGFRLTTAPNPHEVFPYQLSVYDGTRSAADTTAGFGITNAGYYPFRLVYFQATGPASLELFSVALSGQKILVNDTNTAGSIRGYRSATNPQPYVQSAYPYRNANYFVSANNPVGFTLVDGTPAINTSTIQLTINGTVVTPIVTRANGTNIYVSYVPSSFQQTTNTTVTMQLTYTDASGRVATDAFSFILHGYESIQPLWTLPPGSRSYLTSSNLANGSGSQQAGLAYNPVMHHLVLSSLQGANATVRGFYLLDPATGADLGQLKLTNSSGTAIFSPSGGSYYPGYMVGVADDGAIYAANWRFQASANVYYKIYRWGSEADFVNVVFSDSGGTGTLLPFTIGSDFRVRGAGTNTQIIAGGGSSSAQAVLFKTIDGTNFTATVISTIPGISPGDLAAGIAFGSTNTLFGQAIDGYLSQVSYDPVAKTGNLMAAYPLLPPSGQFGPIGVDLVNGRVIALATSKTNAAHSVNLFDLNVLSTSNWNYPVDTSPMPTANTNLNESGSVAITPDGSMVFVLDTENGIMTYEMNVKSTAVPAAAVRIAPGPGSSYTVSYSGSQVVNYILLSSPTANAPMTTWTAVQTNSGTLSSSNFIVAPSGARTFYRVSSRSY